VNGNIAALLRTRRGFHPELTGARIYLSESGPSSASREKRINPDSMRIVEFSGLEKFLDTPIKNYSSGMVVRLGFFSRDGDQSGGSVN